LRTGVIRSIEDRAWSRSNSSEIAAHLSLGGRAVLYGSSNNRDCTSTMAVTIRLAVDEISVAIYRERRVIGRAFSEGNAPNLGNIAIDRKQVLPYRLEFV
jgi:hypothetical protein